MLNFVVGTRPEAIKIGPVVAECKRRGILHQLIHTGQHTSLFQQVGLEPDLSLGIVSEGNADQYVLHLSRALRPLLRQGWTVVQGDTASAYAAAMVGAETGRPVYHIEAGVRTGRLDNPWPEEGYRVFIDEVATDGCCATQANRDHVIWKEGFPVTGNPGVDACLAIQSPIPVEHRHAHVVITLHRRESWGSAHRALYDGIVTLAHRNPALDFWWPMHPNPAIRKAVLGRDTAPNLHLEAPARHQLFLHELARAYAVITDSGGVQEDAATLGIPCVVARDVTDRPESVSSGQALVVGRTTAGLLAGWDQLATLSTTPSDVFGDGRAAGRIAQHLTDLLDRHDMFTGRPSAA